MEDIHKIYTNSFGMAFKWKRAAAENLPKIHLIFRDTGMLLSTNEIQIFSALIEKSLERSAKCGGYSFNKKCKSILLETPIQQLSFALNYQELKDIEELIKGTLFNLGFDAILGQYTIKKHSDN